MNRSVAFIPREARFSPGSVEKDTAILSAVRTQLMEHSQYVEVGQDEVTDVCLAMCRGEAALQRLEQLERRHVLVMNKVEAIRWCHQRARLMSLLEADNIPVPPQLDSEADEPGDSSGKHHGYWVKRGDSCAETAMDVQYAPDRETAIRLRDQMLSCGAAATDVRRHIPGDLLKFYAVRGTGFFRYYYPTAIDAGDAYSGENKVGKFGVERYNGQPHYYSFDKDQLEELARRAADLVQLDIYGGDCIVRPDGQLVMIDLNDWPSFSRCRQEAAEAIARRIMQQVENSE